MFLEFGRNWWNYKDFGTWLFWALIASLLFPLVMLPVSLVWCVAYLVAALNIGVAALILTNEGVENCDDTSVIATMLLVGFFYFCDRNWALWNRSEHIKIRWCGSNRRRYQKIVLRDIRMDTRLLLNRNLQLPVLTLKSALSRKRCPLPLFVFSRQLKRKRISGGGDGLPASGCFEISQRWAYMLVDIDEVMTNLAKLIIFSPINSSSARCMISRFHCQSRRFPLASLPSKDKYDVVLIGSGDPSNT